MAGEQHPVEIIMARGLMSNLTTPAFLVDGDGVLVFYNEAAGELLGLSFEEAGRMPAEVWGGRFDPTRPDGGPLAFEELPLAITLREARPAYAPMRIRSADGKMRKIEVTAFPVVGRAGQSGAMAIFWGEPD
jgi:PAS domain-containing protein